MEYYFIFEVALIAHLLKGLVTFTLVWLVTQSVDLHAVINRMQGASLPIILLVVAALALVPILHALRWKLVLQAAGLKVDFNQAFRPVLVAYFFNQALPTSMGGDVYRVWHQHKTGVGLGAAFNNVVVDRAVAMVALLLICSAGMPWLFKLTGGDQTYWAAFFLVLLGVLGCAFVVLMAYLPNRFICFRFLRVLVQMGELFRKILLNWRIAIPTIGVSAIIFTAVPLLIGAIGAAIHLPLTWFDCLILVPSVLLIAMIPISIAGWGVREGAMVVAFGLVGVSAADALSLSLLFGLALLVASLPGGILWLAEPRIEKPIT